MTNYDLRNSRLTVLIDGIENATEKLSALLGMLLDTDNSGLYGKGVNANAADKLRARVALALALLPGFREDDPGEKRLELITKLNAAAASVVVPAEGVVVEVPFDKITKALEA